MGSLGFWRIKYSNQDFGVSGLLLSHNTSTRYSGECKQMLSASVNSVLLNDQIRLGQARASLLTSYESRAHEASHIIQLLQRHSSSAISGMYILSFQETPHLFRLFA